MILIIKKINLLYQRKILLKLKRKIKFVSMFFVLKTNWLVSFTYQIKNLKIQWIYCVYLMKINHTVSTSKILTDSGSIKQETKTKNTFAKDAYTVLVIKMYSQGIINFLKK